jgi:glycosyltransferase involved in cell wall biosynthesis
MLEKLSTNAAKMNHPANCWTKSAENWVNSRQVMKRVVVSVINDLSSDQRVHKVCSTLEKMGVEVELVGRLLPESKALERSYRTTRMRLWWRKGPAFYIEFQIRLFFLLMARKADLLVSNDLDTLLPNYLVSRLKKIKLVYDTHEYFTGVPELEEAPVKRKIWETVEAFIFPKLPEAITVNASIADVYAEKYGSKMIVVRNVPQRISREFYPSKEELRKKLGIDLKKTILLMQGAGINIDRGAEEAVEAMQYLDDAFLYIIGSGDVFPILPSLANKFGVTERIKIIGRLPYEQLLEYTMAADWGLTLDKPTNLNYQMSLPNKVFDYIQCHLPVISSGVKEINSLFGRYPVGFCLEAVNPRHIAQVVKTISIDSEQYAAFQQTCVSASVDLCWENESKVLTSLYKRKLELI